jgi:hypothetical protein
LPSSFSYAFCTCISSTCFSCTQVLKVRVEKQEMNKSQGICYERLKLVFTIVLMLYIPTLSDYPAPVVSNVPISREHSAIRSRLSNNLTSLLKTKLL